MFIGTNVMKGPKDERRKELGISRFSKALPAGKHGGI
jgi:hypothetical protein